MDHKRIKKQCIIFLLTVCVVCAIGIGIVLARTLGVTEQVLVVRYEDTKSVQEAEELGIDFLEIEEMMIVPVGDDRYRIGVFVVNPNKDWVAESFEYNVVADTVPQRHLIAGKSSVGMEQKVLLVADVLVDGFSLDDVEFVIQQVDWEQREGSRFVVRVRNPVVEYRSHRGAFLFEVSGILVNDSDSFIRKGVLGVIGTDKDGDIVMVGEMKFYSLRSRGEQKFALQYSADKEGMVHDIRFVVSSLE